MDDAVWKLALAAVPVAGAIVVAFLPRWSEARNRRRVQYAEAVEGLVAWAEFPYRIARRVNDDPDTLVELVSLGHQLQERLAYLSAWVAAESALMDELYQDVVRALRCATGSAASEAWRMAPVSAAVGMNVGDLGIDGEAVVSLAQRVARASRARFGWSRLLGPLNARKAVFSDPVTPPLAADHDESPVTEAGNGGLRRTEASG